MTLSKRKTRRRRTEVVIISKFMAYMGSPILPHTFDLEDCVLFSGRITIDALGFKFTSDTSVKVEVPTVKWLKYHLNSLYCRDKTITVRFCPPVKRGESGTLLFLPSNVNLV